MVCLVSRSGRELQRYNNLGCRQVVGCIPYRYREDIDGNVSDELEVLVGGWELDESLEEAACRESIEEAGVIGIVESQLGQWSFISKRYGTYYEGHMFPLFVKEQLDLWPEKHVRRRVWMSVAEAREVCQHWWMKEALDILVDRLFSTQQQKKDLASSLE
ncbi:nudix hydrolase 17, mitochondrial-like [Senna tora]|uniref:Nudix hydrolase 17, mitochondrial-like n=1 Tax=Senna tora TaxID=362788 RepID=A0A834W7I0_9FABA|nr:nudix hydrolase 17, mitochondrial-like [Senna tora]